MTASFIPYEQRPEWKDLRPIPQQDGADPLCPIAYTKEFTSTMDMYRAIAQKNEYSPRALALTADLIDLVPAHYTIWNYRLNIIKNIDANLEEELAWIEEVAGDNPKSYQIWHYRQAILSLIPQPDIQRELRVVGKAFEEDAKNYHAWTFRQWLLRTYACWEGELAFVESLLEDDPLNNSAWNQRYYCVHHGPNPITTDILQAEVAYTIKVIKLAPDNEAAWSYLTGILRNAFDELAPLSETAIEEIKGKGWVKCVPMLAHIVEIYEADAGKDTTRKQRAIEASQALQLHDPIRAKYWRAVEVGMV